MKNITFVSPNANGIVAERLGSGLQNRVQRFESARYLQLSLLKIKFQQAFFIPEWTSFRRNH